MQTFEYAVVRPIGRRLSDPLDAELLNAAAENGWRLFQTVLTDAGSVVCVMERPRIVGYALKLEQQPIECQRVCEALVEWLDDYASFEEVSAFDRWLHPDEVVPITPAEVEAVRKVIRSMPPQLVESIISTFDPSSALVEIFKSARQ